MTTPSARAACRLVLTRLMVLQQVHRSVLAWASLHQSITLEPPDKIKVGVMQLMNNFKKWALKTFYAAAGDW